MLQSIVKFKFKLSVRYFGTSCCRNKKNVCDIVTFKDISKIRNTGILSHIDAGKTTTTERMLYYSGKIAQMGDVHYGNTVTDFMEQEKNRGITIASATVSFPWRKHLINLVDTPGHIDFTMEVEQSLNAMDSAIIVLDASSGVEAQTITVWSQADRKKLPRIVYANKCDRSDASVDLCIKTLKEAFDVCPLLLQYPIRNNNSIEGVVDIVCLQEILWTDKDNFIRKSVDVNHPYYEQVSGLRNDLTDVLSSLDDELAESVLSKESLEIISNEELINAIRRVTLAQKAVPVLCGSSYKNVGVQTLMDAVLDFLPSPLDSYEHKVYTNFGDQLVARVFKILHDKQRGPISYVKVYSGQLTKGQKVYNVNRDRTETVGKLLLTMADYFEEISGVSQGLLVGTTGLKESVTGDIITTSQASFQTRKNKIIKSMKLTESEVESLFGINTHIPEPVFFCSIEPPSQSYQNRLDKALRELQKEDPSLNISYNYHTGQTVLAGMGELHLEIIKDRLKTEYNIDVYLGTLQIAYKEQLISAAKETFSVKNVVGSDEQFASITLSLHCGSKKDLLSLDRSKDSGPNLTHLSPHVLNAIRRGIQSTLMNGPLLSCPVVDVHAVLHGFEVGRGTSETIIAATASQCIKKVLEVGGTRLLEPVMSVTIISNEENTEIILSDIARRRSQLISVENIKKKKEIKCEVPLAELLGYVKHLRTLTSGTATCSMSFLKFREMNQDEERRTIEKVIGY